MEENKPNQNERSRTKKWILISLIAGIVLLISSIMWNLSFFTELEGVRDWLGVGPADDLNWFLVNNGLAVSNLVFSVIILARMNPSLKSKVYAIIGMVTSLASIWTACSTIGGVLITL